MGENKKILLAVTGATGMLYVPEFLALLKEQSVEVHGIVSGSGEKVLQLELGLKEYKSLAGVRHWFDIDDFTAPPASGSSRYAAMVILPCTTGTLGAIAGGYSGNLIHRAADVTLKERRPLVLAVRETPLNRTHLRNMLAVQEAGGIICPPMPSFYLQPKTLQEMARQFAARICDQIGLDVDVPRWSGM
ncbi:MAG: UbiX family flavin prenyltransferase [Desulfobulbaceae bacterium]|nr:UbiX family flavin prenyltransferase [Desulfobulbaceae bacterium]